MKIEVTREDLVRGIGNNPRYCPVARAFKTIGMARVDVRHTYARFNWRGRIFRVALPKKATRFICNYDKHKTLKRLFKPFSFQIKLRSGKKIKGE